MKHLVKPSFLLVLFAGTFHNEAFSQKRTALVKGNNSYKNPLKKNSCFPLSMMPVETIP
jgi:hypothetical protein